MEKKKTNLSKFNGLSILCVQGVYAYEVVLVLDENNSISASTLYQLGLITKEQYNNAVEKIKNGEDAEEINFAYTDVCNHTFYLVAMCDYYEENENGTFTYIESNYLNENKLVSKSLELKISGIIRPKENSSNESISTAIAYSCGLTDYIITHTNDSKVIKAQESNPSINVLTGMPFIQADNLSKAEDAKNYLMSLSTSEKASFYKLMMYYTNMNGNMTADEETLASYLDMWLTNNPSQEILLKIYDEYLAGSTYEANLKAFGKVSYETPSSISIYTDTFENKEAIASCISKYNETAAEDAQITYTDYVALLTSSLTAIIDGISYVLVAFVSISLIVSCIMIGIITHISVMERTKEIGILRALGASKQNISQVFNAETFIIGCCAGVLGIGISYLALIPINSIIAKLTGINDLKAKLSLLSALVLICISVVITIIGGLLPAKKAAKKDPVVALRTE